MENSKFKDFQFTPENIRKLFGNEAGENENPERLREYYFKNDIFKLIANDLPIHILVGHKGIGKSALFKVASFEDKERNDISFFIKPDDIVDLGRNIQDLNITIRQWKVGLFEIILKKVLIEFKIYDRTSLPTLEQFDYNLFKYLKESIKLIEQKIGFTNEQREIYKMFQQSNKVFIYIDDVDRGWISSKEDIARLSALLNAIRDMSTENNGLLFRISLRSDVYFLVRTSDESTDKIEGSVSWYKWTTHEIFVMLIKRIRTFFGYEVNDDELLGLQQNHLEGFLEPIIQKTYFGRGLWAKVPTRRVLLSMIRKRPRDLVKLLTLAAQEAYTSKANQITAKHFESIFAKYSNERITDTVNEYKSELPGIDRLILNMKPNKKTLKTEESYVYTTSKLIEKIRNITTRGNFIFTNKEQASEKELAQFLYKINFITGRKVAEDGFIDRKYFDENQYLFRNFVDFGYDWEIHLAYRWALQPDTLEDIFRNARLNAD